MVNITEYDEKKITDLDILKMAEPALRNYIIPIKKPDNRIAHHCTLIYYTCHLYH